MTIKMLALITAIAPLFAATLAVDAADLPTAPASAAPAAAAVPAAVPAVAPAAVEKAPRMPEASIRVKVPLFSPLFDTTPVASVNDELITVEEIRKTLESIHEGMGEEKSAPKRDLPALLNRLINIRLITQESRSIGFDKQESIVKAIEEYSNDQMRQTLLVEQVKNVRATDKDIEKAVKDRSREWRLKSLIFPNPEDVTAFEAGLKSGKKFDDLYAAAIAEGRAKEGGKPEEFVPHDAIVPALVAVFDKMKPGDVSKPLPLEKSQVIYRIEEVRSKEDPNLRMSVSQEQDKAARIAALETYKKELLKKLTKVKKKIYDKLDYHKSMAEFKKLLKDKRVLVEIKDEKPITVAEFTENVQSKFFHGVERAITGKKINAEKDKVLDEMLTTRIFMKDARDRHMEENEGFRLKLKKYSDSLLFNEFITKIVREEIRVTSDELDAYYKAHAKEYTAPGSLRLTAIAFDDLKKAEVAVDKLRTGTDLKWTKANAEGQMSISKEFFDIFNENELTLESLPEKLQKVVKGAASGDFIVFPDGKATYAVAVLEAKKPQVLPYNVVEDSIKERVFYEKLNAGVDSWAEKLRKSSDITIFADFDKQEKP